MREFAHMIPRFLQAELEHRLAQFPAVGLLGPRQAGKTTLALSIAKARGGRAVYLDLENAADRRRLEDPIAYLRAQRGKLVILDEIHRAPEIFATLRGEIDARRRAKEQAGHFLILGSAALDLLRQTSESLAGRIGYLELTPFLPQEVLPSEGAQSIDRLWLRGGFPGSFLAANDAESMVWRRSFIGTYLERDIPQFGVRVPADILERFWTMLAHSQGALLNSQRLAQSLGMGWHAVAHYLGLLADLLLVRRLLPWTTNAGKRLVKSPKIYLRDSGLLHALLNLQTRNDVFGHPIAGASWEGFALEAVIAATPEGTRPYFYRAARGDEIDLVLELSASRRWAIEFKKSLVPTLEKGFHIACADIGVERRILVYPGDVSYPGTNRIEVMPLMDAVKAAGSG